MELRLKLATSAAFVSALVSNRILMPMFDRGQGSNYASSRKNELRHCARHRNCRPYAKRASLVAYVEGCIIVNCCATRIVPIARAWSRRADGVPEMKESDIDLLKWVTNETTKFARNESVL